MADTFTLHVRDKTPNQVLPTRISVKAYPIADSDGTPLKKIRDTAGNVVLSGHVEASTSDADGVTLLTVTGMADPRDTDYHPTNFGWLVKVKTNHFDWNATFGAAELDDFLSGGILELEDVVDTDPAAFVSSASYAMQGDLSAEAATRASGDDALDARLDPVETALAGRLSDMSLSAAFGPLVGSDNWLKAWAANIDNLIRATTITRDANGAATAASVVWPDGSPGAYTADTVSTAFPGAVDAYHVTYGSPATKTVTQPALTRDSTTGAVTNRPALTVA